MRTTPERDVGADCVERRPQDRVVPCPVAERADEDERVARADDLDRLAPCHRSAPRRVAESARRAFDASSGGRSPGPSRGTNATSVIASHQECGRQRGEQQRAVRSYEADRHHRAEDARRRRSSPTHLISRNATDRRAIRSAGIPAAPQRPRRRAPRRRRRWPARSSRPRARTRRSPSSSATTCARQKIGLNMTHVRGEAQRLEDRRRSRPSPAPPRSGGAARRRARARARR